MPLYVRGFNPIWAEFDLTGLIFDDSYYMYTLENTLPYQPQAVYHTPSGTPWDNPIRFLGNGTLPVDIYFDPDLVYRLEFRKNNGIDEPSQNDPLIYEVNNYLANGSGTGPSGSNATITTNQITNPQFALISFASPVTISGTNPDPIEIGPGWFLEVAGTGSVTLTQVLLNDTNPNPSNAPYALRLTLSGWNANSVFLRQRFQQNGILWANQIVSSAITARVQATPISLTANLVDSNGTTLGQVLNAPIINGTFNEYTGHTILPASTNPNTPPAAYIDYKLAIPSNADVDVTSIQVLVQTLPVEPSFEQDSINRQIDHTYNTAYPIVPVGTIIDFGGFTIPGHYFLCDGSAKSRTTNNLLFQAITKVETVTLTTSSPDFTVTSSADYYIGMSIEGNGIPSPTTIFNISGTTITMSNDATITGSSDVRFFAYGNGDGSTTFNVPDLRDFVLAGVGGSLYGTTYNGIGSKGTGSANPGAASVSILADNLPVHTHGPLSPATNFLGAVPSPGGTAALTGGDTVIGGATTGNNTTAHNNLSVVQQTALVKKCIRFE